MLWVPRCWRSSKGAHTKLSTPQAFWHSHCCCCVADIPHEVRAHLHGVNILHRAQTVLLFPKTTEVSPSFLWHFGKEFSSTLKDAEHGQTLITLAKWQTEWVFDSSQIQTSTLCLTIGKVQTGYPCRVSLQERCWQNVCFSTHSEQRCFEPDGFFHCVREQNKKEQK